MNEPNDTAQEGFDQLKRNLEVCAIPRTATYPSTSS